MSVIATQHARWWAPLGEGLRGVSWTSVGLILAINTGFAGILSIEDVRPFWHPFITAQAFGLAIAYCVRVAAPWGSAHPVRRLIGAVAAGTLIGVVLIIAIKGYIIHEPDYRLGTVRARAGQFTWTAIMGFWNGLLISLLFMLKFREAHAQAEILKAQADRNLLAKHAVEAELKLMQAQIEPHFLFNTLASIQFLTETDPPKSGEMLGHLLAYLRAALPQLRSGSRRRSGRSSSSRRRTCRSCACAWDGGSTSRSKSRPRCARSTSRRCSS